MIFFPRYLFARLDFDIIPLSSVAWMPGVRRIVSSGSQPAPVPDEVVELVRERLEEIEEVRYGNLRQGDRVRITSGPLRDLEAIFDQPTSSADRVRILLDVMGRLTSVEIDPSEIKPI